MNKKLVAFCAVVLAAAAGGIMYGLSSNPAPAADAIPDYVTKAVADRGRTQWDVARDPLRKPADVLAFAQIKPGMKVVDFIPGEGYYTRMIAKLVGSQPGGELIALVPGGDSRGMRIAQRMGQAPAYVPEELAERCILGCYESGPPPYILPVDLVLAIENIKEYRDLVTVMSEGMGDGDMGLPWQADVIFTANGYHELHYKNLPKLPLAVAGRTGGDGPRPLDAAKIAKGAFKTIKNGGYYVVIDFAAAKGAGESAADALHRTDMDAVKAEILAAGFVLDGESKALAVASDNHTTPALGKYAARDNADQYMLRFKKPENAPNTNKRPETAEAIRAIIGNYYGNTHILRADLTEMNTGTGQRLRYHFYNEDGSYQEFGRVGEGAGPMQSGMLFWDSDGQSCMLHEFPLDERANTVCHDYVIARPVNQISDQYPTRENKGAKMNILPGYVHIK